MERRQEKNWGFPGRNEKIKVLWKWTVSSKLGNHSARLWPSRQAREKVTKDHLTVGSTVGSPPARNPPHHTQVSRGWLWPLHPQLSTWEGKQWTWQASRRKGEGGKVAGGSPAGPHSGSGGKHHPRNPEGAQEGREPHRTLGTGQHLAAVLWPMPRL